MASASFHNLQGSTIIMLVLSVHGGIYQEFLKWGRKTNSMRNEGEVNHIISRALFRWRETSKQQTSSNCDAGVASQIKQPSLKRIRQYTLTTIRPITPPATFSLPFHIATNIVITCHGTSGLDYHCHTTTAAGGFIAVMAAGKFVDCATWTMIL